MKFGVVLVATRIETIAVADSTDPTTIASSIQNIIQQEIAQIMNNPTRFITQGDTTINVHIQPMDM